MDTPAWVQYNTTFLNNTGSFYFSLRSVYPVYTSSQYTALHIDYFKKDPNANSHLPMTKTQYTWYQMHLRCVTPQKCQISSPLFIEIGTLQWTFHIRVLL